MAEYVVKNPCQQADIPQTTLASMVEAVLGAVWFDSNKDIKKVKHVIEALHLIRIDSCIEPSRLSISCIWHFLML